MNIIELCLSTAKGGLELYVYRASKQLSATDKIFPVLDEQGFLADKFRQDGYEIHPLSISFKPFPYLAAKKLAKIIDENNIDVVHLHWIKDLPLASIAKKFSKRKPRLVYTRQMQITRSKDDWYHNFIYKELDALITITKSLAEDTRRFLNPSLAERVVPLYYGVAEPDRMIGNDERSSIRNEWGFSENTFVVGLFGRIKHEKGQHLLIEAISKLRRDGYDIGGLIVGHSMDDDYQQQLKNQVDLSGLSGSIVFKGFVDNPQRWMQACDLIALASKEETFGLVLAEAMHAGMPVIGTNSGGVPEIIEHGETGLLFEFGDAAGMAKCILDLKNDEEKRNTFANLGQQKAQRLFTVESHYRVLREILQGNN